MIVARLGKPEAKEVVTAILYEDPDKNKRFDTADKILAVLAPR